MGTHSFINKIQVVISSIETMKVVLGLFIVHCSTSSGFSKRIRFENIGLGVYY